MSATLARCVWCFFCGPYSLLLPLCVSSPFHSFNLIVSFYFIFIFFVPVLCRIRCYCCHAAAVNHPTFCFIGAVLKHTHSHARARAFSLPLLVVSIHIPPPPLLPVPLQTSRAPSSNTPTEPTQSSQRRLCRTRISSPPRRLHPAKVYIYIYTPVHASISRRIGAVYMYGRGVPCICVRCVV